VWGNVKDADLFISHPVHEFVPANVTPSKVGYLPATTDWLDGLNKDLSEWDFQCTYFSITLLSTTSHSMDCLYVYCQPTLWIIIANLIFPVYCHDFEVECHNSSMYTLDYPARKYIVQIARFDPAKGIPDVLASYATLRRQYMKTWPVASTPQLVIAGHGAIDDPDASRIYKETLDALATLYSDIAQDVIVMLLGPSDQLLNALMSGAHIALQLSTREGFEVKVSEALHKGVPIIATRRGGIPLQVQDGKSGFLVDAGDSDTVAERLFHLFTDEEAYRRMCDFAKDHVSDEVSTVGNALAWLFMADSLSKGEKLEPSSRWINDMARERVGLEYVEGETRLPRDI
jgi:glycosyltransferase involved in cell wall biosynthesis